MVRMKIRQATDKRYKHLNLPSKAKRALACDWLLSKTMDLYMYPWLRTDHGHVESAFKFFPFFVKFRLIGVWNELVQFRDFTGFTFFPLWLTCMFFFRFWNIINLSIWQHRWRCPIRSAHHWLWPMTDKITNRMTTPNASSSSSLPRQRQHDDAMPRRLWRRVWTPGSWK